jgi:predicted aldo/keto reductase-like oxidoreductase
MQYRQFGKLDWKVSALGFGLMRLPRVPRSKEAIDEAQAFSMVRHAIDEGVNYLDTAYMYHGGQSETFLAKVLKDGYRKKVRIADKMPTWLAKEPADFDKLFQEQLDKVEVKYFDFYLLHSLNRSGWKKCLQLGVLEWAEKMKKAGKFQYFGFSFHDDFSAFKKIIDDYDGWDFCQIQYNYMDVMNQAGTRGLRYAAKRGMGVIVMEPLRGGKLAKLPAVVKQEIQNAPIKRKPADWALQWVWDQPEVSLVLSGMSNMKQVEENLVSADHSGVGSLSREEKAIVVKVRESFKGLQPIPCTSCQYCVPCPNGVFIPDNFSIFNQGAMMKDWGEASFVYTHHISEKGRASACIDCNECEPKCPQKIMISDWMPYVDKVLSKVEKYDGRMSPKG